MQNMQKSNNRRIQLTATKALAEITHLRAENAVLVEALSDITENAYEVDMAEIAVEALKKTGHWE